MKIERTKNASRNVVFGVIQKLYQIIIPFAMRTALLYFMGIEYLGLNSLFVSILQVLNLAELGVGSAMVYCMYKPIIEDDEKTIDALMQLYKTYYRIIGLIVLCVGMVLIPFIPKLVKKDIPNSINIYVLYILNLATTVFSYWLFAYKNSLLQAHQRTDVVSKVTMAVKTVQYILQICVLIFLHNYYAYIILELLSQIMTNICTAIVANKMFPNYKAKGKLPREQVNEINKRIKDLFTSKLGSVIVNSADTIVISAFLGLSVLAIYQNYFFILSSIIGFVTILFSSCTAGVGNSLIVETKEKNFGDFRKFTLLISWISGFCVCCLLCVYQPFISIWVGDKFKMEYSVVVCLCIYYYIYEINQLLNFYKDAAGMWHEDRFRPLVTALSNLAMNLIMVNYWGIYGVVLSTVLSTLFIGMPWLVHNLFTVIFDKIQLKTFLAKMLQYILVTIVAACICIFISNYIQGNKYLIIVLRLFVCCIVPNVFFMLFFHNNNEYKELLALLNKVTKGKIPYIKKF